MCGVWWCGGVVVWWRGVWCVVCGVWCVVWERLCKQIGNGSRRTRRGGAGRGWQNGDANLNIFINLKNPYFIKTFTVTLLQLYSTNLDEVGELASVPTDVESTAPNPAALLVLRPKSHRLFLAIAITITTTAAVFVTTQRIFQLGLPLVS